MPDYQPTEQDIFYIQERTVGITETTFQWGDSEVVIIDASGCKSERRKWIHQFQDVLCILFVVDLSGYDECLIEDRYTVRIFTIKLNQDWRLNNKPVHLESDARCNDDLGFNMPYTMVSTNLDSELFARFLTHLFIHASLDIASE